MINFIKALVLKLQAKAQDFSKILLLIALILMVAFLVAACFSPPELPTSMAAAPAQSANIRAPHKLAIYYGWPSTVHCPQSPHLTPAEIFSRYHAVVLGEGLADPSHPDHENTVVLINDMKKQDVLAFGYIDMGLITRATPPSFAELEREIIQWKTMGVSGIFWDDVGHEFAPGLNYSDYRHRVDSLVDYTHAAGLRVFLNVWNPEDIFELDSATDSNLTRADVPLREGDIILAESWLVSDNVFVNPMLWYHRAEQLKKYRRKFRFSLACLSTGDDGAGVEDTGIFRAAYWASVMYQCDFFQFTNPQYSAGVLEGSNQLNCHSMPPVPEQERLIGDVDWRLDNGIYTFTVTTSHGMIHVTTDGQNRGDGYFSFDDVDDRR